MCSTFFWFFKNKMDQIFMQLIIPVQWNQVNSSEVFEFFLQNYWKFIIVWIYLKFMNGNVIISPICLFETRFCEPIYYSEK